MITIPQSNSSVTTDYYLIWLRVNGCYFWFNIFQILLTVIFLVCLFFEEIEVVSIIEITIAFFISIDLMIKYFSEGTRIFFQSLDNRINIVILIILIASIVADLVMPNILHHDSGVIAGLFIAVRYILQLSRLLKLVSDSKKVLEVTKNQQVQFHHQSFEEEVTETRHT